MCPWPRIQAALTDTEALNVTYRSDRGEPRMSVKEAAKVRAHGEAAGDCIDCMQCVAVCPTGVDIRKGSQLGCIQCGLCIDACDAVMAKVHRPTRLIAYDTDENLRTPEARRAECLPAGSPAHDPLCGSDRGHRLRHALRARFALEHEHERPARARALVSPRRSRAASATAIRCVSRTSSARRATSRSTSPVSRAPR